MPTVCARSCDTMSDMLQLGADQHTFHIDMKYVETLISYCSVDIVCFTGRSCDTFYNAFCHLFGALFKIYTYYSISMS